MTKLKRLSFYIPTYSRKYICRRATLKCVFLPRVQIGGKLAFDEVHGWGATGDPHAIHSNSHSLNYMLASARIRPDIVFRRCKSSD